MLIENNMKRIINRLDVMIAYSCNISCRGCISVSDIKRNGVAPFADIVSWIDKWANLLDPKVVTLFGGEPCLHPELLEICKHVRQQWPATTIRLITNGYLLDNFDSTKWFEFEPFEIQVSIHRADHESHINSKIKSILSVKNDWRVTQHGGNDHKQLMWTSNNFSIYKSIFKDFVQPYQLDQGRMVGYNSDPAEAHKICGSPNTPILYKGDLYKCPPVANIIDLNDGDFYDYKKCTGEETLDEFVANINRPEAVCAWCPAQAQATIINHFDINNVQVRHKNLS